MAIDLAKELARQFSRNGKPVGVKSATLHRIASGTRTVGAENAGTNPTTMDHRCKAYVDTTTNEQLTTDGSRIPVKQQKVLVGIFGASIAGGAVPQVNDKVTIASVTYRLTKVVGDGVGGVYEFEGTK